MNGARSRNRAPAIRVMVLKGLADGRWHTTTELAGGRTSLTEDVYRTLPALDRQGLIEVVRGGPRVPVQVRIIYNPQLLALEDVDA